MQHLFILKLFAILTTLIAAIVGGIWPLWRRHQLQFNINSAEKIHTTLELPAAEAIAAGIFLAAGLLHMLADSTKNFIQLGFHYPISYLLAAIVFLILLGLEHTANQLKVKGLYLKASFAILTATMLIIHSLLEGLAVGISDSFSIALVVFLAIISHKSAASFALSAELSRSTLPFYSIIILFSIFAAMTPTGILIGNYVTSDHYTLLVPTFTAMAAGTFLYMGTLHGFERASLIHQCCSIKEFLLMLCGFIVMAIIAGYA